MTLQTKPPATHPHIPENPTYVMQHMVHVVQLLQLLHQLLMKAFVFCTKLYIVCLQVVSELCHLHLPCNALEATTTGTDTVAQLAIRAWVVWGGVLMGGWLGAGLRGGLGVGVGNGTRCLCEDRAGVGVRVGLGAAVVPNLVCG